MRIHAGVVDPSEWMVDGSYGLLSGSFDCFASTLESFVILPILDEDDWTEETTRFFRSLEPLLTLHRLRKLRRIAVPQQAFHNPTLPAIDTDGIAAMTTTSPVEFLPENVESLEIFEADTAIQAWLELFYQSILAGSFTKLQHVYIFVEDDWPWDKPWFRSRLWDDIRDTGIGLEVKPVRHFHE